MRVILTFVAFYFILPVYSQSKVTQINENATITRLNDYFLQYNLRKVDYPGWRIQVFASTDRREMESNLSSFKYRFPQYAAKWTLNDPYYQIRAGIFIDYSEALQALNEIRKTFRSATLLTDRIRREEVLSNL